MVRVYLESLGCPKNRVDSERTLGALRAAGAGLTGDREEADILLVNTCGFIDAAKEESIEVILDLARIKRARPGVTLAVMGCLSQRYRDELAVRIPEIDHLFGVDGLGEIVARLAPGSAGAAPADPDDMERVLTTAGHWTYLKIAEGCSNTCSFCVIPLIRGPYRSRPLDRVVDEARRLAARGVRELILVAQDTTLYGADLKIGDGLGRLLDRLSSIEGLDWIRTLYLYPPLLNDPLLARFARLDKVIPYFDVPFQHASDRVLARMNRSETNVSIRRLVGAIRETAPGAVIRTSFIVGFPGETDKDFEELIALIEESRFNHLGVFLYSPEEGSGAYGLPGAVERAVAHERLERLMEVQRDISAGLLRASVGRIMDVIVDGFDQDETLYLGRTRGQAPEIDGAVILDGVDADPGEILPLAITGATDYDLIARYPAGEGAPVLSSTRHV